MALDKLTIINNGGLSTTSDYRVGVLTATKFVGPIEGAITSADATFTGNVSIGGTLTYEDVTNIDSVGIITARDGIDCNGDIDVDGHTNLDNVSVAGVTTITSSTFPLNVHADTNYQGILVNGNAAPTVSFAHQNTTTPDWKIGLSGSNHTALAISEGTGNTNRFTLNAGGGASISGTVLAEHLGIDGYLYHNADTNTKLQFGTDTIDLQTGGSTRLRAENSGVVMTGVTTISASAHISNANGSVFFGAGNATAYGSQGGIGRASNANYHIGSSAVGDLCIAAEGSKRILFGTKTGTGIGGITKRMSIASNGLVTIDGNLDAVGGIDATANSTFAGDLDVDGHTNLDNVSIAGVSTFQNNVRISDDYRLQLGNSQDLQIWHTSSYNFIDAVTGSAGFFIRGRNNTTLQQPILLIRNDGNTEDIAKFTQGGSVELYHSNTKRFETMSYGAKWTGILLGADNQQLQLGSSGDLQIYHDGTNSYIDNANTGILRIRGGAGGSGRDIQIQAKNGEYSINAIPNGAVELYFDNSKKLETTTNGVTITGDLYVTDDITIADDLFMGDSDVIRMGDSEDLKILHTGSESKIDFSATAHNLIITGPGGSNFIDLQPRNGHKSVRAIANAGVELYHDNVKKFETSSAGVQISGHLQLVGHLDMDDNHRIKLGTGDDLQIYHDGTNSYLVNGADGGILYLQTYGENSLKAHPNGQVELFYDGTKKFETTSGGAKVTGFLNVTTGIHIPNGGNNDNSITIGSNNDLRLYHDGNHSYIIDRGTGELRIGSDSGIRLTKHDSETVAFFDPDGVVELYYDNSKKLETVSGGIQVNGQVYATNTGSTPAFSCTDNGRSSWGSSDDLVIYHSSSDNNSFIDSNRAGSQILIRTKEAGGTTNNAAKFMPTGAVELYFDGTKKFETQTNGVTVTGSVVATNRVLSDELVSYTQSNGHSMAIKTRNAVGNEVHLFKGTIGGATELYYNSYKKFETQANGVTVTGGVYSDGVICGDNDKIELGNAGDLKLYHDSNNSIIGNNTGALIIATPSELLLRSNTGQNMIRGVPGGESALYHANAKKLNTLSGGVQIYGNLAMDNNAKIQTGSSAHMVSIQGGATNMGGRIELRGGNGDGDIRFFAQGGTSTQQERMRISKSGAISSAVTRQAVSYTALATPTYYTHSATGTTNVTIDVSSVFSVPDNAKAILVQGWYHISGYGAGAAGQGDHASSHFAEYNNWATAHPWSFYHSTSTNWGQYVMDHDGDATGSNGGSFPHHYGVWAGQGIVNVNPNGNIYGRLYWGYSGGTHYNQLWCFGYYI